MKSLFTALFISSFAASSAFAGDCDKCKKGDKKEDTIVASAIPGDCDKCKKGDKKEDTLLVGDCDKCTKGDKKGTLA